MVAARDLDGLWDNFLIETDATLCHADNINELGDAFLDMEIQVCNTVVAVKAISENYGRTSDILNTTPAASR